MNNRFQDLLQNRWFELAARWTLGVAFVYASYHKIMAPAQFAEIIYGYGLFPDQLINLIAVIHPFIELVTGISLIAGVYLRSASLIIMVMLAFFILIISINLVRGHEFDCGCFSVNGSSSHNPPWVMLVRDAVLLVLGFYVFRFKNGATRLLAVLPERY